MNILAFDTETHGLDWYDGQNAFLATGYDGERGYCWNLMDAHDAAEFVCSIENADVIIAHNLPFDAHQVRETLGVDVLAGKVIHDTNILARLVVPQGAGAFTAYKLKTLATKYLGDDSADGELAIAEYAKKYDLKLKTAGGYYRVWDHSDEGRYLMEHYAVLDAKLTYDLWEFLHRRASQATLDLYKLEMQVMRVLIEAEKTGVKLSKEKVNELAGHYNEALIVVRDELERALGTEALGGAGSDAALLEGLQKQGIPLHRKTKTGELSTAAFALQEFEDDYPVIANLSEYRRLNKFLSTYIGALEGRDVIHTSFHQCDAWTGRMSSSRPNMQNFPKRAGKELREVFVPREGHAFVVCDYESIEIRLLAYYLHDSSFTRMIEEGHDAHAWMAANIWGGSPEMYAKDGPNDHLRGLSKNILFAITYGAGGPRVADMLKAAGESPDIDYARTIISSIKASLPNYYSLTKRIKAKVETDGFVTTLMGRKQVVNPDKAYVGLNALIQGSAADVMKQGLVNVQRAIKPLGGKVLLVVHDEVVVEVPVEQADNALGIVTIEMCKAADVHPSLSVSGKISTESYGHC